MRQRWMSSSPLAIFVANGLIHTLARPQEVIVVPANPDKTATGICTPTHHHFSSVLNSSSCSSDANCSAADSKCDRVLGMCTAFNQSLTALIGGNCASDADCETSYRCHREKCHYAGAKFCQDDRDCLRGMSFGLDQQCRDMSNSTSDGRLHGNRCWLSKLTLW
ncbi:hypothetical protein RvY_06268-2 [Ramazzottius varieornatus]|uniref:Dickkopf N-terminal cysteine-rich domain-containing protein n=1 Tax=Ramazzottius varieornatus TaxID=947166 RepID=A0A1D1V6P6_RAMVA|nr:hypothetical protein RvY_06268-2 [Ramazzottius varieornatus]